MWRDQDIPFVIGGFPLLLGPVLRGLTVLLFLLFFFFFFFLFFFFFFFSFSVFLFLFRLFCFPLWSESPRMYYYNGTRDHLNQNAKCERNFRSGSTESVQIIYKHFCSHVLHGHTSLLRLIFFFSNFPEMEIDDSSILKSSEPLEKQIRFQISHGRTIHFFI